MSMDKTTGTIEMARGDTEHNRITLYINKVQYEMQTGDEIHFGVKKECTDEDCLIRKTYTENPFVLAIDPADTQELDFGQYFYDLEFVAANGYTKTFARKKKLKLLEEVYTPAPEPEPEPEPDPEEEVENDG